MEDNKQKVTSEDVIKEVKAQGLEEFASKSSAIGTPIIIGREIADREMNGQIEGFANTMLLYYTNVNSTPENPFEWMVKENTPYGSGMVIRGQYPYSAYDKTKIDSSIDLHWAKRRAKGLEIHIGVDADAQDFITMSEVEVKKAFLDEAHYNAFMDQHGKSLVDTFIRLKRDFSRDLFLTAQDGMIVRPVKNVLANDGKQDIADFSEQMKNIISNLTFENESLNIYGTKQNSSAKGLRYITFPELQNKLTTKGEFDVFNPDALSIPVEVSQVDKKDTFRDGTLAVLVSEEYFRINEKQDFSTSETDGMENEINLIQREIFEYG
ncbi:MAG: hypothetical protein HRS57_02755, partial [Mycoplasmataceae bacterium]|nr:hypothetical protein [Mycoplasmataceae bacterium]